MREHGGMRARPEPRHAEHKRGRGAQAAHSRVVGNLLEGPCQRSCGAHGRVSAGPRVQGNVAAGVHEVPAQASGEQRVHVRMR